MFFLFQFDESTKSQKFQIFKGGFFSSFLEVTFISIFKSFFSSRCLVVKGKVLQPLALTLYAITLAAASWFTQGSPIYVLSIVLLKACNKSFVISWCIIVTGKYGWLWLPIFLPCHKSCHGNCYPWAIWTYLILIIGTINPWLTLISITQLFKRFPFLI